MHKQDDLIERTEAWIAEQYELYRKTDLLVAQVILAQKQRDKEYSDLCIILKAIIKEKEEEEQKEQKEQKEKESQSYNSKSYEELLEIRRQRLQKQKSGFQDFFNLEQKKQEQAVRNMNCSFNASNQIFWIILGISTILFSLAQIWAEPGLDIAVSAFFGIFILGGLRRCFVLCKHTNLEQFMTKPKKKDDSVGQQLQENRSIVQNSQSSSKAISSELNEKNQEEL